MGVQSQRQVRAALAFVARPLLFAIALTVVVRVLFGGDSSTSTRNTTKDGHLQQLLTSNSNNQPAGPDTPQKSHHDLHHDHTHEHHQTGKLRKDGSLTTALVVASTSQMVANGDTAWLADVPPPWQPVFHYVTDAPLSPALAVPVHKGNEAMAYLSYIVDHYDTLADVVVFHHGHRRGWHQEMDSVDEVRRLRVEYVAQRGYASLRCLPGCENIIVLADYAVEAAQMPRYGRDVQLTTLLDDFLDKDAGERVPVRLASPCCAQFAASRAAIRRRSRAWWTSLRQWVVDTPLRDAESGRLLEHTWHIWLGNESYQYVFFFGCPRFARSLAVFLFFPRFARYLLFFLASLVSFSPRFARSCPPANVSAAHSTKPASATRMASATTARPTMRSRGRCKGGPCCCVVCLSLSCHVVVFCIAFWCLVFWRLLGIRTDHRRCW